MEFNEPGNVRNRVEGLKLSAFRRFLVRIANAQVQRQAGTDAPVVLCKSIKDLLRSVVDDITDTSLRRVVSRQIVKVELRFRVLIIATRTLCERLRGNLLPEVAAKLERVIAPQVREVINYLVVVFDSSLRIVSRRSDVHAQIKQTKVWESGVVQARETKRSRNRERVVGTTISKPGL